MAVARVVGAVLALLLVASACGDDSSEPATFDDVARIVATFVHDNGLDGAGLIVVDRDAGVVFHEHWGGFGEERVSLVASSSKVISAGVLLALQDRGLLDIERPIAELAGLARAPGEITVAQLLSNSSGLVGLDPAVGYEPYACQWDPGVALQACGFDIATTARDDADVIPPGSAFRYGGGQWQVAGAVAEAVSGRSWAELVDEIYVEPCGTSSLGYTNQLFPSDETGFVYPADFDPGAATGNPNIEAGAHLTTGDYGALLLVHLRGGRCGDRQVLSEEAVELMRVDRTAGFEDHDGPGYGLGWWIDRSGGRLFDPGAYGAYPWIDPDAGYGAYLVLEANAGLGAELADELTGVIDEVLAG